jgi:hypothetical protein
VEAEVEVVVAGTGRVEAEVVGKDAWRTGEEEIKAGGEGPAARRRCGCGGALDGRPKRPRKLG